MEVPRPSGAVNASVVRAEAIAWLSEHTAAPHTSVVTSLPDRSELEGASLVSWRAWFVDAARAVLRWVSPEGVAVFYQTDVRHAERWIDKAQLVLAAGEAESASLIWHKIVCRMAPGTANPEGRPSYSHLLCLARAARAPRRPSPDVLADAGPAGSNRSMGFAACQLVCDYLRDETSTRCVVDPFCGTGSVLAVANVMGFDTIGVDLNAKRCRGARTLQGRVRALHATLQSGAESFDRGEYFQAHEAWEELWRSSTDESERRGVQGLIQIAAAFHKLFVMSGPKQRSDSWRGASTSWKGRSGCRASTSRGCARSCANVAESSPPRASLAAACRACSRRTGAADRYPIGGFALDTRIALGSAPGDLKWESGRVYESHRLRERASMGKRKPRKSTAPIPAPREVNAAQVRTTRPVWIASALLYASLFLLYAPSLSFAPISLDDTSLLTRFAEQPLSSIWAYDHFGHLRPVKNLFFYALSRHTDAVPVFRALVLLCFVASTALVQQLASRLLDHPGWGLAAAALWAWNPTATSVVGWLAAANVAFCLLGLLTFAQCAGRALERVDTPAGPGWNTPLALAGLLLAVLSHELALLAPTLLLLNMQAMRSPRARLLGVGSAVCVVLLLALRVASAPPATSYRFDVHPAWLLVVSAARYMLDNLRLWLWPSGRFGVLFADQPREHLFASVLCWVVVIAAGVFVVRASRRDRALAYGAVWAGIFLVPVTNVFPLGNTPVALHYLYIPSVGLAVILTRGLLLLGAWIAQHDRARRSWLPASVVGLAAIAWLPEQQRELRAWGDEELLYWETVRADPRNVEARVNLVSTLISRDRHADAAKLIEETLPLAPQDTALIRNAFAVAIELRPPAEALEFADEHAAQLDLPVHDFARGELFERLERHDEAGVAFERAFARAPTAQMRFAAGYRLAIALVRTQRSAEASRLIERLLEEYPGRQELLLAKRLLAAAPVQ